MKEKKNDNMTENEKNKEKLEMGKQKKNFFLICQQGARLHSYYQTKVFETFQTGFKIALRAGL